MKYLNYFSASLVLCVALISCSQNGNFEVFGENFEQKSVMKPEELSVLFDKLDEGDTTEVIFSTNIQAVCQKKGCWMDVDISNDEVVRVTFLDYGFFVPLNAGGSEAIIKGKAFWKSETLAEKRHYAEDAGQDFIEEELDEEVYPHIVATGVLIKK